MHAVDWLFVCGVGAVLPGLCVRCYCSRLAGVVSLFLWGGDLCNMCVSMRRCAGSRARIPMASRAGREKRGWLEVTMMMNYDAVLQSSVSSLLWLFLRSKRPYGSELHPYLGLTRGYLG